MFILRCIIVLALSAPSLRAQERITTFTSTITVNADATLHVQETIEVISTGATIIHGIVREFPTSYTNLSINYVVDFNVQSVTHNGNPAPFFLESVTNGKKIYIGDKDRKIAKGKHTYTITYTTNRQLGFFEKYDELYWNVTGNGWRLPIDKVYVTVQLPPNIPSGSITAEGYTGFQSEQGKNYTYDIKNNRITFSTTHRLEPRQGFTIAMTWPKGFVQEPSWYQQWYWFIKDNLFLIWTLLAFILLLALILYTALTAQRKNEPGTVIPLFYPPADFTPSVVGFMKERKFNNQLIAADIVNLAVRGFITISFQETRFFNRGTYTLKLRKDPTGEEAKSLKRYEVKLLSQLFNVDTYSKDSRTLVVDQKNAAIINTALEESSKHCHKQTSGYITELSSMLYLAYALCIVWVVGALFFSSFGFQLVGYSSFFLLLLATTIKYFYRVYTPQGRIIQDQIDGFELYLTTAETERMELIGTPPTKTPELYEKYLPYAIALGVEKRWTQQFASVFAKLAQQGHEYRPRWYTGRSFRVDSFASSVGSSFNSAISSAATPPGKSSGSGGRGSSGGGGGGGGGGGW